MSKTLNWSAIANVNFDDNRRKVFNQTTGKELFQKAHEALQKSQAAFARRKEIEPVLRKALFEHMATKTPIRVLAPISNPTETFSKSGQQNGDDDGFYNSSPSMQTSENAGKFVETIEQIPVGIDLTYKSWDKPLGQFLFKASNGREYGVYDKSVIIFQGQAIENPGLYGLLFNTSLIQSLGED